MCFRLCLILFSCAVLAGCQEGGFFAPIADVSPDKLPIVRSRLVIGCFISPQDTIITASVTESTPLGDTLKKMPAVGNALVALINSQNDTLRLVFQSQGYYQKNVGKFRILAGETYRLAVIVPDGRVAKAVCTIPKTSIPIVAMTVDSGFVPVATIGETSIDSTVERFATIRWIDEPGVTNYYRVYGWLDQIEEIVVNQKPQLIRFSKLLYFDEDIRPIVLTDQNQDGKQLQSPNGIYWRGKYAGKIRYQRLRLYLINTDKNYFDYYRSLTAYNEASQNPFAEPYPVRGNIEGGLGCFAAFTSTTLFKVLINN